MARKTKHKAEPEPQPGRDGAPAEPEPTLEARNYEPPTLESRDAPDNPEVARDRISRAPRLHRYTVPVPGLDPAHDGLIIAHLSDLHVGSLTAHDFIRSAVELVRQAKPDLVLMTGDYVCYSPKFVPRLGEVVAGLAVPTVCVLGNHDYWTDGHGVTRQLTGLHYDVLRNQHTELTLRHAPFTIVGVDDAVTRQSDIERAFRGARAHSLDGQRAGSRLVLAHVPSLAEPISAQGPALILSGHTHGGHVQIPGLTNRLFKKLGMPYVKGFYRLGDSLLYVNCGIGSSSIPIRAGAPAEVALLTLRRAPLEAGAAPA
jgi:predicted MPP superfamily phosphohydrolase